MAINYFSTGITAQGYKSLLKSSLTKLENVIYIKGCIDTQPFAKKVTSIFSEKEYNMEFIINPYNPETFEAIINKTLGRAVIFDINNSENHKSFRKANTIIDMTQYVNKEEIKKHKNYLKLLQKRKKVCLGLAHRFLHNALLIHNDWEKLYINNMDFEKANQITAELVSEIIGNKKIESKRRPTIIERFIGANTPIGAKNCVESLTATMGKRYLIKGRPGTGKSTMMRAIAKHAIKNGFDIEIYYCGFDSKSVDMLIIKELNTCIFDCNTPHEFIADKSGDKLIDVYAQAVAPSTDEENEDIICELGMRYKSNLRMATTQLATMNAINTEIKEIYQGLICENDILTAIELLEKKLI